MDKVYDFFKDLKERISSPFFSSFIISWLAFNWMFIVTIFKYDVSGFTIFYYNVYIDYANSLLSPLKSIWLPLISAFSYSLFYPFLRNGIEIADVWFKKWGNNSKIKVAKGSNVSVEKYIKLREIYELRTKTLEDVLKKESEAIETNEILRNDLIQLTQENIDLKETLSRTSKEFSDLKNLKTLLENNYKSEKERLKKFEEIEREKKEKGNVQILNGKWNFHNMTTDNRLIADVQLNIDGNIIYEIKNDFTVLPWLEILKYTYIKSTNSIILETRYYDSENKTTFYLSPDDNFSILRGNTGSSSSVITFERF